MHTVQQKSPFPSFTEIPWGELLLTVSVLLLSGYILCIGNNKWARKEQNTETKTIFDHGNACRKICSLKRLNFKIRETDFSWCVILWVGSHSNIRLSSPWEELGDRWRVQGEAGPRRVWLAQVVCPSGVQLLEISVGHRLSNTNTVLAPGCSVIKADISPNS